MASSQLLSTRSGFKLQPSTSFLPFLHKSQNCSTHPRDVAHLKNKSGHDARCDRLMCVADLLNRRERYTSQYVTALPSNVPPHRDSLRSVMMGVVAR
jgi:hypothetical protein